MSERFVTIYRLPSALACKGSPVIIEAGVLLHDSVSGSILVQLKLKNIGRKPIHGCSAEIIGYGGEGAVLETVQHHQILEEAPRYGVSFGSKAPYIFKDSNVRSFTVRIVEVLTENGTVEVNDSWTPIPSQKAIHSYFSDPVLEQQHLLEVGQDARYIPVKTDSVFLCSCGSINPVGREKCAGCQKPLQMQIDALDPAFLQERANVRLKEEQKRKEEAEAQRLENLAAAKKGAKIGLIIAAAIAAVCLFAFLLYPKYIQPSLAYKDAVQLMEDGNYKEAEEAFKQLGTYKDSASQVLEAHYQYAVQTMNDGKPEEAKTLFKELGDYKDSADLSNQCNDQIRQETYEKGIALKEAGNYLEAIDIFIHEIPGYQDSKQQSMDCCYEYAKKCAGENNYAEAVEYMHKAFSYFDDAPDLYKQYALAYAMSLENSKDYKNAVKYYREAGSYATSEQILNAEYQYVLKHPNHANTYTMRFLNDLVKNGYRDSAAVYSDITAWKLTFLGGSNYEDATVFSDSISKYKKMYLYCRVTGGDDQDQKVTYSLRWPDGSVKNDSFTIWGEDDYWVCWYYYTPENSYSGYLTITYYIDGKQVCTGSVYIS